MRNAKLILSAAAAIVAMVGVNAASAADLPARVYTKAPAVVVDPGWTGWYVGVNAGGDWGRSRGSTTEFCSGAGGSCYIPAYNVAINALGVGQGFNTSGFTGGVQGGYNWQSGSWLVGFEVDFDAFRARGSRTTVGPAPIVPNILTINSALSTDWLLTARPRVGVVTGNWLFYGTGGLAVTNLRGAWSYADTSGPYAEAASATTIKAGYAVGAGFETMFSNRWTVGLEYLYTRFNGVSASGVIGAPATAPFSNVFVHSTDLSDSIVRVRLNKLF